MSRAFGYIALMVAVAAGLYIASQHFGSVAKLTNNNPQGTVDVTGVQNDLLAIAHAERRYMAANGKYLELGELISSGELSMPTTSRGPYSYSVEVTSSGFTATARAENPPTGAPHALHIDDQMNLSRD